MKRNLITLATITLIATPAIIKLIQLLSYLNTLAN